MFQTKFVHQIKPRVLCSVTFFLNRAVYEIMWKNIVETDGQAADDSMEHVHCILHTQGYKKQLKISNNYSFFTAIMVAQTRLNVTLCVRCLSCCTSKLTERTVT
jgi:ABC-type transport system involved in cytochrome c biogenesis ATPase subunit